MDEGLSRTELALECGCKYQTSYRYQFNQHYKHAYGTIPRLCRRHWKFVQWVEGWGMDWEESQELVFGPIPDVTTLHEGGGQDDVQEGARRPTREEVRARMVQRLSQEA